MVLRSVFPPESMHMLCFVAPLEILPLFCFVTLSEMMSLLRFVASPERLSLLRLFSIRDGVVALLCIGCVVPCLCRCVSPVDIIVLLPCLRLSDIMSMCHAVGPQGTLCACQI